MTARHQITAFVFLRVLTLGLALLSAPAIAADPPQAAPACELHVWPSNSSAASNASWLSNFGIGGAIADYRRNRDGNLRDQVTLIEILTRPLQARAISEADLPSLLGMPAARLVFESASLEPGSIGAVRTRRSGSTAPCYAELIVALNMYQSSPVRGRRLTSHFSFKDFRGGKDKAKPIKGRASAAITLFPPQSPAAVDPARDEIAQAFAANVREFVQSLGRKRRR